jgi:hypothetical protein
MPTTFLTNFAAGGSHGLNYVSEATYGLTPGTPTMVALRHTSCSLQLSKDTFQSKELRSDRQISDFRHGTHQVGGDLGLEFSWAEFDTLFEAGFGGTWQTLTSISAATISTKTTGSLLLSSAATFTVFNTGDCIYVTGFTGAGLGTNGVHLVTGAKPLTMTLAYSTLASKAASSTIKVKRLSSLKNGTTQRAFTFERGYTDATVYERFSGCIVNGLSLSLKPNAIVTGAIRLMGKTSLATVTALSGAPTASQTSSPFDTFTGAVKDSGTSVAYITSIDFNLDNAGANTFVIGSKYTQKVVLGRCNVTGTVEVFLSSPSMINKFINETSAALEFDIGGTDNYYKVFLPNVKFGGAEHAVDNEGPITLRMPFQAVYSGTYGYTAQITRCDLI